MDAPNIISIVGLVAAFISLYWSWRNSNITNKLTRSDTLFKIHESNRPGRQAMLDIFRAWNIEHKDVYKLTDLEKDDFMNFYNKNYRTQSSETVERRKSQSVHLYLHNLHHLWRRLEEGEFSKEEIFNIFGSAIEIDSKLIDLFFKAHRTAHPDKIFWEKIPSLLNESEKWASSRNTHR